MIPVTDLALDRDVAAHHLREALVITPGRCRGICSPFTEQSPGYRLLAGALRQDRPWAFVVE